MKTLNLDEYERELIAGILYGCSKDSDGLAIAEAAVKWQGDDEELASELTRLAKLMDPEEANA